MANIQNSANYEKLKNVLKEVFQLDQADLDFGIYRIMNQKRNEINDFLDNRLLPQVIQILQSNNDGDNSKIKQELDKAIEQANSLGVNPDTLQKVIELKSKLSSTTSLDSLEQEVYSHLANFFKRYYKEGDFVSLRRYKKDVYAVPYEGEEVKLHWANHDQYYIKSSEYLKNYGFKLPNGKSIKFELKDASTEQNNNKEQSGKERRFQIFDFLPLQVLEDGKTLIINFTYESNDKKVTQDKLNNDALEVLVNLIPQEFHSVLEKRPTEKNKNRTLLEKHIVDFTSRNTFDYFIHKDLGGFLNRELDFYIKNEVLYLDDINTENEQDFSSQLSKVKAIKQVAQNIITFLAQLENFQKKLWLKKKFVVSTNYLITLDRIPEKYYEEITKNKEQLDEWKQLFKIDKIKDDLLNVKYSEPLSIDFLIKNPYLVIDTKFFSLEFKNNLIAEFDNLTELTNGILINSDNFHGTRLLQPLMNGKIQSIYIDPPYNTVHSKILYKNQFEHSSWLSLLNNNLSILPKFWRDDFTFGLAIDDFEYTRLSALLQNQFPNLEQSTITINHHPQGSGGRLSRTHEYYILLSNKESPQYLASGDNDVYEERSFMRSGTAENNYRYGRWKSFYALLLDPQTNEIVGAEDPPELDTLNYPLGTTSEGYERIYPINSNGEERVWRSSYLTGRNRAENSELFRTERGAIKQRIHHENKSEVIFSNWIGAEFNAGSQGSNVLKDMGIDFDYPKSIKTMEKCIEVQSFGCENNYILDYFAGSGTTGHAVINLNRQKKDVNRKFILIDVGSYFSKVMKPRIIKAVYSNNWSNGIPLDNEGISTLIKYIDLESYEDVLNNLSLIKNNIQSSLLESSQFKDEYLLSYMLNVESRESLLNIDAFKNPFNYKLNITRNNESLETIVDLVETFNFLVGMHVKTMQTIRGFKVITGVTNERDEQTLIIWRNIEEKSNQDLNEFFTKMEFSTKDSEFQRIYVNGDNHLENLKTGDDNWKVVLIEDEFIKRMFDIQSV
jgi:adenine-specific DNA-methyltransferase